MHEKLETGHGSSFCGSKHFFWKNLTRFTLVCGEEVISANSEPFFRDSNFLAQNKLFFCQFQTKKLYTSEKLKTGH